MTDRPLACLVLAAGKGTRMKSDLPKVLHPLAGRPMVQHVLAALAPLAPERIAVVVGPDMESVADAVAPHPTAVQHRQAGTADAVLAARDLLADFAGDVLVLYGDTPLVTPETLAAMVAARRGADDPAVVVLGMRPSAAEGGPGRYGRLIVDAAGGLQAIVEYAEATEAQRAIDLCNGGFMAFDGKRLFELMDGIGNANAKGEYYLTDAVALARAKGWACAVVEGSAEEVMGVDDRAKQARAEMALQNRLRARAMEAGVTLIDPATIYFAADTVLGRDVVIGPSTIFGPGVTVEDGVEIKGFCHIEGAIVRQGATIGPFARLRPGAVIGSGAHVGNFVEIKNTQLGPGAKANHLTYLGDATVGPRANIGAGTITCNYDGFAKHRTVIGAGAFIGSNSSLVAPVVVGDGAITGAGSVVAEDVPADALALERGAVTVKDGWAARFRAARQSRGSGKDRP